MQAWSSSKSFRQISRWSSPAPAMMCSPDSSIMHCTIGSDLARRFNPSTSLGKSCAFFWFNSNSHDRRNREFHHLQIMCLLKRGDGSGLDQKLVDSHKSTNVTTWYIFNSFDVSPHHKNCSLDSLFIQIFFFARNVIRAHNSGLQACGNLTRKDTSKGVETSFVRCGYHFRNVHHKRAVRVTIFHRNCSGIIIRSLVQHVCPVLLGSHW